MASIKTLTGKDGKARAYKVIWRGADGREVARTLPTLKQARLLKVKMEGARLTGLVPDLTDAGITVAAYGERWRAARIHRPRTARIVERVLVDHLYPVLGHRPIASVGPTDLQAWVKGRAQQPGHSAEGLVSASTLATEWVWICTLFRAAVADGHRSSTPCATVSLPEAADRRAEVPTFAELEAVAGEVPKRWAAMVWVGVRSGLRPGELRGLCVGQIDFLRGTITVDRQATDAGELVATTKTRSSRRVVPIDRECVEILAEHLAAYPAPSSGVVFSSPTGEPYPGRAIARGWERALARLGARRITPHATRHFYASALIAEGASLVAVKERLGHASVTVTGDIYGHLFEHEEDRTRDMISNHLARAAVCPRSAGEASSL